MAIRVFTIQVPSISRRNVVLSICPFGGSDTYILFPEVEGEGLRPSQLTARITIGLRLHLGLRSDTEYPESQRKSANDIF